jgi:hypothetical protein
MDSKDSMDMQCVHTAKACNNGIYHIEGELWRNLTLRLCGWVVSVDGWGLYVWGVDLSSRGGAATAELAGGVIFISNIIAQITPVVVSSANSSYCS